MAATHQDNITIAISLQSAPIQDAGFGGLLLLVDQATNTLDSNRFVTYTSITAATADNTAGFISASTLAAVTDCFSQSPSPQSINVARVDVAGAETYSQALSATQEAGAVFYFVMADSRTAAVQVALAATIEASGSGDIPPYLYIMQSSDADWLTTGYPAAYSTIEGLEQTAIAYHDTDGEWMDVSYAAAGAAYDQDVRSIPWDRPVLAVAAYATDPTSAQKAFLDANDANHGLRYGSATFFVDAGVTAAGRPIHERVTADWFYLRLLSGIEVAKVDRSARGLKWPIDNNGGNLLTNIIDGIFAEGVAAGHFTAGTTVSVFVEPTAADIDAMRIRASGSAQFVSSARIFNLTFDFYRS